MLSPCRASLRRQRTWCPRLISLLTIGEANVMSLVGQISRAVSCYQRLSAAGQFSGKASMWRVFEAVNTAAKACYRSDNFRACQDSALSSPAYKAVRSKPMQGGEIKGVLGALSAKAVKFLMTLNDATGTRGHQPAAQL